MVLSFRLRLVRVKVFPENILFSGNAIFRKGKCFHVFGCISKNVLENIFWCLVVFLKIPQKTHFLLVAHIFSVAKRIYNIINSSIQKHKQNPEKKSSNPVTFSHIFSVAKQQKHKQTQKHKHSGQIQKHKHFLGSTRGCNRAKHHADRDRCGALRDLGGRSQRSRWTISARSAFLVVRSKLWTISLFSWPSSFFLWLSLSLLRVEGNCLKVK